MKILTAELVESDKRVRISGGLYIEFTSIVNVVKDSYFRIVFNDTSYVFQAVEISVEGELLRVRAIEVGYWAVKLDRKEFDLRTIIGVEVIPVTDEKVIANIREQSCWC